MSALPNDGTGLDLVFPDKTVTSLRLRVDATLNDGTTGLAELEAYGPAGQIVDYPPVAAAGLPQTVASGSVVHLDGEPAPTPTVTRSRTSGRSCPGRA